MSARQIIHIVAPPSGARDWLLSCLMHALQATGVSGALLEEHEAEAHDNAALREHPGLGRVALVTSPTRTARHDDLAGDDVVITLQVSAQALEPAAEVDWLTGVPTV